MNMLRKSVRVSGLGLFLISLFWVAQSLGSGPGFDSNSCGRRCNRKGDLPQSRRHRRYPL